MTLCYQHDDWQLADWRDWAMSLEFERSGAYLLAERAQRLGKLPSDSGSLLFEAVVQPENIPSTIQDLLAALPNNADNPDSGTIVDELGNVLDWRHVREVLEGWIE